LAYIPREREREYLLTNAVRTIQITKPIETAPQYSGMTSWAIFRIVEVIRPGDNSEVVTARRKEEESQLLKEKPEQPSKNTLIISSQDLENRPRESSNITWLAQVLFIHLRRCFRYWT
jgi:hypothetical protein